jgi:hypothetical protein
VGQDGIPRADGIGALRTVRVIGARPVDNRLQDAILPHCQRGTGFAGKIVPALTLRVIGELR